MKQTHLSQVISNAMKRKKMDRITLITKMGYRNQNKGLRRLDSMLSKGEFQELFLKECAMVLALNFDEVFSAVNADDKVRRDKVEQLQRAHFKPYIYLKTEQTRPSSITMFALTGGTMKHKAFYVPENLWLASEDNSFSLIGELIREHFNDSDGIVAFFGKISGYLYCPTYDDSYDFSINGDLLSKSLGHFYPPMASVRVK